LVLKAPDVKIQTEYFSYLIRLWRDGEKGSWRVIIENPHNGKRYGFSDIDKLIAFLEEKTNKKQIKEINHEQ
jgi:hypothetical protein